MLLQIDEMYNDEVNTALRWLSFESRPLTLGELNEACLIDPEDADYVDVVNRGSPRGMLELLAGLIFVEGVGENSSSDPWTTGKSDELLRLDPHARVKLAHFSVKEYLTSDRISRGPAAMFAMKEDSVQEYLAQSCVGYILHYSSSLLGVTCEADLVNFPFLRYAASSWPQYLLQCQPKQPGHELKLLVDEHCLSMWLGVFEPDRPRKRIGQRQNDSLGAGVHYASFLGLRSCVSALIEGGADIEAEGGRFGTALQAASGRGHKEIVEMLLEKGANVKAVGGDYGTALQDASVEGHKEIVEMLLKAGANVKAEGIYYGTALQAASVQGDKEIVEMLLKAGANVKAAGGDYGTALQAASVERHQEIVEMLLKAGADVKAVSGGYGTALQAASVGGDKEVVGMLLKAGADVKARGGPFGTALQVISERGDKEIVEMLLKADTDVEAEGGAFDAALLTESRSGS